MPKPRGENIRDIRVRRGEKRSALAERVGISYKHLYGIERGYPENPPSIEVLHRIATALDVNIADVMADEPTEDDDKRDRRPANPTTHPEPARPEPPPNPTRRPGRMADVEPGAA
jgi:transcriptional regulator with XRE-family HTH domain